MTSRMTAKVNRDCNKMASCVNRFLRSHYFCEWQVDATRKLGNGSFGVVYAGTWRKRCTARSRAAAVLFPPQSTPRAHAAVRVRAVARVRSQQ